MLMTEGASRREYEEPKMLVVDAEGTDIITASGNDWTGEWDYDF